MHSSSLISVLLLPLSALSIPILHSDNAFLSPSVPYLETRMAPVGDVVKSPPKEIGATSAGEGSSIPHAAASWVKGSLSRVYTVRTGLAELGTKGRVGVDSTTARAAPHQSIPRWDNGLPIPSFPHLKTRMAAVIDALKTAPKEVEGIRVGEGVSVPPIAAAPQRVPAPWKGNPTFADKPEAEQLAAMVKWATQGRVIAAPQRVPAPRKGTPAFANKPEAEQQAATMDETANVDDR